MSRADLTVIVVNYNTSHLLHRMFKALGAACADIHAQVIVVDNASRDDSVALLRSDYPEVTLLCSPKNVGFGRANNLAIPHIQSDNILLLNTDAFVSEDSIKRSLDFMANNPDVGVLGVRLVGSDGVVQPSCRYFPTPFNTFVQTCGLSKRFPSVRLVDSAGFAPETVQDCDWVPGCFYLTRREVVAACGLFDPRFFLYFEEVDHCQAVKAKGWRVVYFPGTSVVHLGGESAKSDGKLTSSGNQLSSLQIESEIIYFRKHHGAAGLVLHMLLSTVASCLQIIKAIGKWLLRGVSRVEISHALATQRMRLSVLFATQFGLKPLR